MLFNPDFKSRLFDKPLNLNQTNRVKSGNWITLGLLEETRVRTKFWALYKHQSENPKMKKVAPCNYLNFGIFQNI